MVHGKLIANQLREDRETYTNSVLVPLFIYLWSFYLHRQSHLHRHFQQGRHSISVSWLGRHPYGTV